MRPSSLLLIACFTLSGSQMWAQITGKTNLGSFGPPAPKLELKLSFTEPSGDGVLDAGEKGSLKVTVTNTGESAAEKVQGTLTPTNHVVGLTFDDTNPLGNIDPKGTKEATFLLEASDAAIDQTITFIIQAATSDGVRSAPQTFNLRVRGKPVKPLLTASLEFTEPSGNGMLDAGEVGTIKLTIQNIGAVAAKNLMATISATPKPTNVSLRPAPHIQDPRLKKALEDFGYREKPLHAIGNLDPKSSYPVTFEISALETVPSQVFTVTLDVSGDEGVSISERISITTKERIIVDTMPPEIIITTPSEFLARGMRIVPTEIKTTSSSLTVEGVAKDTSGIASVLINGASVELKLSTGQAEFSYTVPLILGQNPVEVVAIDRFKNESKLTFVVRREEPLFAGQNYGLLFAINSYDSWPRLTNPIFDARAIAEELKRFYGFDVELIEDATQDRMLSVLRRYAARAYGDNDQLFIFFAGHGQFDEVLGDGYLVAKDSKLHDDIKTSYVSHSNLRTIINNIPCKHIFLVVDACFGGTFDPLIAANLRGEEEYREVTKTEFIQRKMRFRSRRFLTSGGKEYVPDGRPGQHSPFTRKFLEALRSYGGKDGILTINEILQYVEKVKPEPRAGEFGANEPGSDFIFIAR